MESLLQFDEAHGLQLLIEIAWMEYAHSLVHAKEISRLLTGW